MRLATSILADGLNGADRDEFLEKADRTINKHSPALGKGQKRNFIKPVD